MVGELYALWMCEREGVMLVQGSTKFLHQLPIQPPPSLLPPSLLPPKPMGTKMPRKFPAIKTGENNQEQRSRLQIFHDIGTGAGTPCLPGTVPTPRCLLGNRKLSRARGHACLPQDDLEESVCSRLLNGSSYFKVTQPQFLLSL